MLLLFTVHTAYAYSPYLNSKTFPRSKVRNFRFTYSYIQYLSCSPISALHFAHHYGMGKISTYIFLSIFVIFWRTFIIFWDKFWCSSDDLEENMPLKKLHFDRYASLNKATM